MSSTGTRPEATLSGGAALSGAALHWRALEGLYASAPVNGLFKSSLEVIGEGHARIRFEIDTSLFHAAGAAHGTVFFKMLDDAAFYAANTMITDRFLLTSAFNLHLTKPLKAGTAIAEGRWIGGRRRVLVAESRLIDADGEEAARGTGTFVRSRIALSSLPGYAVSAAPD
jgi:uncharacterized protein (TIGR00369 family)